jgi:hypothetical protein
MLGDCETRGGGSQLRRQDRFIAPCKSSSDFWERTKKLPTDAEKGAAFERLMRRGILILGLLELSFVGPAWADQPEMPLKSKDGNYSCVIKRQVGIFRKNDGTMFAGEMPVPVGLNEFVLSIRRLDDNPLERIICEQRKTDDPQWFTCAFEYAASFTPTLGSYKLLLGKNPHIFDSFLPGDHFWIRGDGSFTFLSDDAKDSTQLVVGDCAVFTR